MAFELKEKKEQYGKVVSELQDIAKNVKAESRAFSNDEKEKVERLQNEEKSLRSEIDTLKALSGVDSLGIVEDEVRNKPIEPAKRLAQPQDYDLALRGWLASQGGFHGAVDEDQKVAASRTGIDFRNSNFEIRQQSTTDAEGGHFVEDQTLGSIVKVLKNYGGMRQVSTVINQNKNIEIKHPVIDDTANKAGRVAELAAFTNTDLVVGEVKLSASGYRSGVFPISLEVLRDSSYPLQSIIANALGERLGRAINADSTNHADFTGMLVGATAGTHEYTNAGMTYTDLVTMQGELETSYQPNAKWMFNSSMLSELQLMVDENGLPLWRPDLIGGNPGLVLGKPYVINDDCAQVAYGDFSKYHMVEVGTPELVVLRERFRIENNAIAVCVFGTYGGGVVDAKAIKKFDRASS